MRPANGLNAALPIGQLPSLHGIGQLPSLHGPVTTRPSGTTKNLFPKVTPGSVPSPAPRVRPHSVNKHLADPVANSSPIPLGTSEFGAQVLGLVLLALGVVIAVTRLSARRGKAPRKPTPGR